MKLNSLFLTPLGAAAPIGVNRKCGAEAAMSVAGLLGSVLDYFSSSDRDDMNLKIARETNEANQQINESQLAWARDQYSQEKAENRFLVDQAYQRELENRAHNEWYNSAAQQVARLRAAGINPALAMYGGSGSIGASHSSINAQIGQNPHANQPSMIPMESGAPVQGYTGFGRGISDTMANFFSFKANEREDYRLANDITVSRMEAYAKLLDSATKAKEAGTNEKYVDGILQNARQSIALDEDKFAVQNELNQAYLSLEDRRVANEEAQTLLKRYQVDAEIRLSNQQISYLGQLITESAANVDINKKNAQSYGSLVANEVIHMINQDADAFERLGLDKDMIDSQKFKNYVGSVADGLATGAAIYFGVRNGAKPMPIRGFGRP